MSVEVDASAREEGEAVNPSQSIRFRLGEDA